MQKLEITPLHQSPGRVRLHMPCTAMHVDERGQLHAGALASIVDIAAVTASWSLVPRREGARGSTIGMQVSYPSAAAAAVVADAHVQQRSEELLFSTVHVTTAVSGQLVAMGQVSYRLLEPWPGGKVERASRVHALLFEVELALEASHHVVVDRAPGAKAQERLALRVDDRAPDLAVLDELSVFPVGRRIALPLDVLGTVPIRVPQPIEQWAVPRPDLVELIDPPSGGLDELLPGAGPPLRAASTSAPSRSDRIEPRQRQPLPEERRAR